MPYNETLAASRRWRMTNAPGQISPDFPPTLIRDLIAILVGCLPHSPHSSTPLPPPTPHRECTPTASNTVKTPHLATGYHIKAASTCRKTSAKKKKRGPVAMATYGSFSEWPHASISLLGWELIKCINHSRGPFRNTCWDECRWQEQVLFFTLSGADAASAGKIDFTRQQLHIL